ncbi:MAG: DNA topology modulation protein [Pyrinomonadaceae bacterium]|nr:DNA topology modulation protein [Pyrinomonadaceae bacterium]
MGSGGAGKSTFSRRLGEITGIEVFHLDKLYWRAGWIEPPKDEWRQTVEGYLKKESWIMDGNFGGTMDLRLAACDTAILLDLPRSVCLYRVLKRRLKYRNTNRPDMSEGCHEKIDYEFLKWIWDYPKTKKPRVEEKLKRFENEKTIIHLKSQREVEDFFANYSQGFVLK